MNQEIFYRLYGGIIIIKKPCNIKLKHILIGQDNLFLITGGVEHIGAVATAYWDKEEMHISLKELPHHKEGELACECAELATKTLNCTCTVVMGIHIDNASDEDIDNIIRFVRKEMSAKLNELKNY